MPGASCHWGLVEEELMGGAFFLLVPRSMALATRLIWRHNVAGVAKKTRPAK